MANALETQSFSYLENMVSKPTWKDILLDLISSESIDPWNIDLVRLADDFLKRVKAMEKADFIIHANVILAAAILLKYKSNYLRFLNYQSELPDFPPEDIPGEGEDIPQLTLSSRIPPKRQFTLDEILVEMERIIKYDTGDRVKVPRGAITEVVDLELPEHDIEHDLEDVLQKIRGSTDNEGWSLFSRLTPDGDIQKTVYNLLCVLYLVQREAVDIRQDKMFGEIFIRLLN